MKTFLQIKNDVIRLGKISINDTTSINSILTDANDAISTIASQRAWDELYKKGNLTLVLADGDKDYALASDVDKLERVRITLPVDYARVIEYCPRKEVIDRIGAKTNNGTGTPTQWYFDFPTISATNLETKNMSFDVMPDQDYTIEYAYRAYSPLIVNDADYPFFDRNYHQIVVWYCLWKYAERNPDPTLDPVYYRGEWENGARELMANYQSKVLEQVTIKGPNFYA
jgi:hypothetical protein